MGVTASIRESQRALMQRRRAAERDLKLPEVEDLRRRNAALADVFVFLETYFGELFDEPWTDNRREMVNAIFEALQTRTAQAIAAPRGEGKSTITVCVMAYCICRGLIRYAVIIAATSEYASDLIENLKAHFERNDLLLADFPEICVPVRDVATSPNKAASQTCEGELTYVEWSADEVVFPKVAGSAASGVIVASKGITSATRGLNRYGNRPDLVVIDDPDDEESADSDPRTEKRVRKINASISGLAKRTRGIARVMLCTLINRTCVAAQYTDRTMNPAWNGKRYRAIDSFPKEEDAWKLYVEKRHEEQEAGDKHARGAHALYLENRAAMDAGAVVANPYSFNPSLLPDGTRTEESALQACYNIIADRGWETFLTEYQNDPPDDTIGDEDRLTATKVKGSHKEYVGRVADIDREVVPENTKALTITVDVQKRGLYYEVVAWFDQRRRHVVSYGYAGDATLADRIGVAEAVRTNLRDFWADRRENPYCDRDGVVPANLILVDNSYETAVVNSCVLEFGSPWRAAMGDPNYKQPKEATVDKRPSRSGDRWYESLQRVDGKPIWQVNTDVNYWKHRCHDSWTVRPAAVDGERPESAVTLFGADSRTHAEFAEQIVSEEWREKFVEGKNAKAQKAEWIKIRRDNHYLDCDYMTLVAGSILGVWRHARSAARPKERVKLSDIQRSKR